MDSLRNEISREIYEARSRLLEASEVVLHTEELHKRAMIRNEASDQNVPIDDLMNEFQSCVDENRKLREQNIILEMKIESQKEKVLEFEFLRLEVFELNEMMKELESERDEHLNRIFILESILDEMSNEIQELTSGCVFAREWWRWVGCENWSPRNIIAYISRLCKSPTAQRLYQAMV